MAAPEASGDPRDVAVEFLVEPFVEGNPGPHVDAAVDALEDRHIDVELGPFASLAAGDLDDVAEGLADMVRSAMRAGATSIQIRVASTASDIPVPTLHNALGELLRMAEHELGAAAGEWDRAQKQAVVRMLEERGAFLLRGAVDDIAELMGVSRITIYNYLNALDRDGSDRD